MHVSFRKLATEKIAPLVRKMDIEEKLDPSIMEMFFENGVRLHLFLCVFYSALILSTVFDSDIMCT